MANHSQLPPRPTLEDLLRFKRSERPAPEFWAEFDRGLRQKQLAALVKRPKGWSRLRPAFVRGLRWAVPATAAAAVATVVVQLPLGLAWRQAPVEVASHNVASNQSADLSNDSRFDAPLGAQLAAQSSQRAVQVTVVQTAPLVEQRSENGAEHDFGPSLNSEHSLPWASVAVSAMPEPLYGSTTEYSVRSPQRESRRPRTSWTSRFSQLVHGLGEESLSTASLQFASLDLGAEAAVDASVGASAAPGRFVAGATGLGRETDERLLRDLDRRFGVTGSSLSIKF